MENENQSQQFIQKIEFGVTVNELRDLLEKVGENDLRIAIGFGEDTKLKISFGRQGSGGQMMTLLSKPPCPPYPCKPE
ncbi:MAG: hypothetical protein EBX50_07565 [Chitinophagia bacterium]|nr:hypothetical protein [Chitinophagia bacterium]